MSMFRDLTEEEKREFRQWARDNYKMGDPISPCWHPVVIDEIREILKEEHAKMGCFIEQMQEIIRHESV